MDCGEEKLSRIFVYVDQNLTDYTQRAQLQEASLQTLFVNIMSSFPDAPQGRVYVHISVFAF